MYISRVCIKNFANFEYLDVQTAESIVIVGENKVGKSNFIRALQLVLDPSLSERDRLLGLEHFWDGLADQKIGATIEVAIDLTGLDDNPNLIASLADCLVEVGPPIVARLTYRFRPKASLNGKAPEALADYEYVVFGGDDEDNAIGATQRRQFPLDVQAALRDAEKDLTTWRRSPLRPLIEELTLNLDSEAREEIQELISEAQTELAHRDEVVSAAEKIGSRMLDIVGNKHTVPISLGLSPARVDSLLRSLRILIDNGARGISDASLGTANLIFLALKSLELDSLVSGGERNHTFFAIEEPEAHLHPHVQRLVYKYFFKASEGGDKTSNLTTILTTHSPQIASVAPLRSIVLMRHDPKTSSTTATSTADTPLKERDEADLRRYIDVTRGELFFSRGIIFVEGDAERFLIPAFAEALGIHLDILGISVCSVGGTNFVPYIKLVGSEGLDIPHVVLTDLDPREGDYPPYAYNRILKLLNLSRPDDDWTGLDEDEIWARGEEHGYYVNTSTLEPELFEAGLGEHIKKIIEQELRLRPSTKKALSDWVSDPSSLDQDKLITLIERIGKGRFAQILADFVTPASCPTYINNALDHIIDAVA